MTNTFVEISPYFSSSAANPAHWSAILYHTSTWWRLTHASFKTHEASHTYLCLLRGQLNTNSWLSSSALMILQMPTTGFITVIDRGGSMSSFPPWHHGKFCLLCPQPWCLSIALLEWNCHDHRVFAFLLPHSGAAWVVSKSVELCSLSLALITWHKSESIYYWGEHKGVAHWCLAAPRSPVQFYLLWGFPLVHWFLHKNIREI